MISTLTSVSLEVSERRVFIWGPAKKGDKYQFPALYRGGEAKSRRKGIVYLTGKESHELLSMNQSLSPRKRHDVQVTLNGLLIRVTECSLGCREGKIKFVYV